MAAAFLLSLSDLYLLVSYTVWLYCEFVFLIVCFIKKKKRTLDRARGEELMLRVMGTPARETTL